MEFYLKPKLLSIHFYQRYKKQKPCEITNVIIQKIARLRAATDCRRLGLRAKLNI